MGTGLEDRDKMMAFIIDVLLSLICGYHITDNEIRALENIRNEFPKAEVEEFRY